MKLTSRTHRTVVTGIAATLAALAMTATMPTTAMAQNWRHEAQNRQNTKNEWRNLAIAAGGLAAFGAIKKDPTIGFLGGAGALYSLNRYEQDRKSQDRNARARASIFSQDYFYRDGQRYDRRLVNRNGERYYQFYRHEDQDNSNWRDRRDRQDDNRDRRDRRGWHPHD